MFVPPEIVHLKCYFRINPVKPDIWNNGPIFLIFWNKTSSLCTVKHSVTFRTDNFPRPFIEMAQNSLTHVSDGHLVWSQQFVWHISAQIVLWTCRNIQVLWRECLHRHLKWIVQPKMKILSTFSYPQVVPNVVWLFFKANSCGYPLMYRKILWRSMETSTVWLPTFFQISSFVFNRRKKLLQVWNDIRVSKWWQLSSLGELFL